METYSASLQAVKLLLCLWIFCIRSWNDCFFGFSIASKMMSASFRPTTMHVAHSFSNRAFPSFVTTPSMASLPL